MIFDNEGRPALVSAAVTSGGSVFGVLAGENRFRAAMGLNPSSIAFAELFSASGQLVYSVQSDSNSYAKSYIAADPASGIWKAAGTFSTLKTFWDILTRR